MRQSYESQTSTSSEVTLADLEKNGLEMEKKFTIEEGPCVDNQVSLPPKDEGWRAWVFLAGSFLAEFIIGGKPIFTLIQAVIVDTNDVTGLPDSFGLFEDYYKSHEPYSHDEHNISVIGFTTLVRYHTAFMLPATFQPTDNLFSTGYHVYGKSHYMYGYGKMA